MSASNGSKKPTVRIIRNLARSGGTLIGKCIGCMDKVTLISEIHPDNLKDTNPMAQAHKWFGLVKRTDLARWKIRQPSVLQFVSLCDSRSQAQGNRLVLRDWSHLDYIGVPFTTPKHGFALRDELQAAYNILSSVTVRHPIDQYLSLIQLTIVHPQLTLENYLYGCARFAGFANEHGFHRYEDFTRDPDSVLRLICEELDLPFDSGYSEKWQSYTTITGDTSPGLGRGSTKKTIQSFDRKPVDDDLLKAFRANNDYHRACELLGYDA